jgi:AraC-like DNA-binding protein
MTSAPRSSSPRRSRRCRHGPTSARSIGTATTPGRTPAWRPTASPPHAPALATSNIATSFPSRNQLISLLPRGESGAAAIAQRLGMSTRSFTRHLAEEGTTFGEILERLRQRLASRYLADDPHVGPADRLVARLFGTWGFHSRLQKVDRKNPRASAKATTGRGSLTRIGTWGAYSGSAGRLPRSRPHRPGLRHTNAQRLHLVR